MTFDIVRDFTDFRALKDIEDDAGERYRALGYEPTPWPTTSVEAFAAGNASGLLWVAKEAAREIRACGFALVQAYPPYLHLDELDVLPQAQGNGIGRALVTCVIDEARRRGCTGVTLRMFKSAAWSRGLYTSLGFKEIEELPPHIAHYAAEETSEGLPSTDFCTMMLKL